MSASTASDALRSVLRDLPQRVDPARIDRLWVFPPRQLGERESGLLVLTLLAPDDPDARDLLTLRYEAERARDGTTRYVPALVEQGRAPAERVSRVINGVLARLDQPEEDPRVEEIAGDPERWDALLAELGLGASVDRANPE